VPPAGLTNWYPRGSVITGTQALQPSLLYNTSTGTLQQLVIAVPITELGFTPGARATARLVLVSEQQTAKDYRQYTYRKSGAFTAVNGVEDGAAQKVLRYNITGPSPDSVEVYVNGVKRDAGTGSTEYQLFLGPDSAAPPNSVLFNTALSDSTTQVDVIITQASSVSSVELKFKRVIDNDARTGTGAWEGVDAVSSPALGRLCLFYLDFSEISATLALDIKLKFGTGSVLQVQDEAQSGTARPVILLSRSGLFTELDRLRSRVINFAELSSATDYLIVKLVNKVRILFVTEDSAKDIFPALQIHRYNKPVLQTQLAGNSDGAQLENSIIIGPDQ